MPNQHDVTGQLRSSWPRSTAETLALDLRQHSPGVTAVRRQPALADLPQPREPYGVAELFNDAPCGLFPDRRGARATPMDRHGGAGGFLRPGGRGAVFFNPSHVSRRWRTASNNSRPPKVETRNSPGAGLDQRSPGSISPPGIQARSSTARRSSLSGLRLRAVPEDVASAPPPASARSLAELGQFEARLRKLASPAEYQAEWATTEAAARRDSQLKEAAVLREAVGRLTQFYFALTNQATSLLQTSELGTEWDQQARALESSERTPPVPKSDPVRGVAYEFDDVTIAQSRLAEGTHAACALRDLATAIGLVGDANGPKAPLALSAPAAGASIPELAAQRMRDL